MIVLQERIALMVRLGKYFSDSSEEWQNVVALAERQNGWFTQEFIELAVSNITREFLQQDKLEQWIQQYPQRQPQVAGNKTPVVGLVMAGNIPLVGFHDFLCIYMSGLRMKIKLSSKDQVLWKHIIQLLGEWSKDFKERVSIEEMLKDCDAYIATGSNNSARYFEQYFAKYPSIIRKNRTSVAILDGLETKEDLSFLADDICSYYGLGCRNVTKIYVPEDYRFEELLPFFNKYKHHADHNKYRNNYDFQLAIFLLNKVMYMTNDSLLVVPNESPFAAISVLHYESYTDKEVLLATLSKDERLQCITTNNTATINGSIVETKKFGENQVPGLNDYADGVDTMQFLSSL